MAIFISDQLLNGGLPIRSDHQGFGTITTRVTIPAGTPLVANDQIKFARTDGNIVLRHAALKTSELDSGTNAIEGTIGTLRATRNPSLPFNASTNPYITGAATADSTASLAAAATINSVLRAGGVIGATLVTSPDGVADVALTITVPPNANPATDRIIELTFEFSGLTPANGAFSGSNTYNYTNETADLD